jgi:hypothetical protein
LRSGRQAASWYALARTRFVRANQPVPKSLKLGSD